MRGCWKTFAPPTDWRDETGTVTVLFVLIVGALLAFAGLVVDGGRAIDNRQVAADTAAQAARSGANALDVVNLRDDGTDDVDPDLAQAAACTFVAAANPRDGCSVRVSLNTVTVTVTSSMDTTMLGLIGISTFTDSATATATSARGYTSEMTP